VWGKPIQEKGRGDPQIRVCKRFWGGGHRGRTKDFHWRKTGKKRGRASKRCVGTSGAHKKPKYKADSMSGRGQGLRAKDAGEIVV